MPYRRAMPSWGEFIRDHLLSIAADPKDVLSADGEDYVFNIYQEYNRNLKAHGYRPMAFSTFVGYIWLLVRLGGIELVRIEPVPKSAHLPRGAPYLYTVEHPPKMSIGGMRHYYSIVVGMETASFWKTPRLHWKGLS